MDHPKLVLWQITEHLRPPQNLIFDLFLSYIVNVDTDVNNLHLKKDSHRNN